MDRKKRSTLKIISGTAAVAMLPTAAFATGDSQVKRVSTQKLFSTGVGAELSVDLDLVNEPVLLLTNNTDELIIVRHVHPGIVHAGRNAYDINSVFDRCAYAIRPGSTRRVDISPTSSAQAETDFPRQHYRHQPQRLVSVKAQGHQGMLVNSSRSFYG